MYIAYIAGLSYLHVSISNLFGVAGFELDILVWGLGFFDDVVLVSENVQSSSLKYSSNAWCSVAESGSNFYDKLLFAIYIHVCVICHS